MGDSSLVVHPLWSIKNKKGCSNFLALVVATKSFSCSPELLWRDNRASTTIPVSFRACEFREISLLSTIIFLISVVITTLFQIPSCDLAAVVKMFRESQPNVGAIYRHQSLFNL
ncbi:hypothetical protein GQX74_014521 [Glossina fuscipes]|nr:hypothetical protein GQX74_014521 [Glossina fuscipes]